MPLCWKIEPNTESSKEVVLVSMIPPDETSFGKQIDGRLISCLFDARMIENFQERFQSMKLNGDDFEILTSH